MKWLVTISLLVVALAAVPHSGHARNEIQQESIDDLAVAHHEIAFWQSIEYSDNPAYFEAYMEQYPNGTYQTLALLKLQELENWNTEIEFNDIDGNDLDGYDLEVMETSEADAQWKSDIKFALFLFSTTFFVILGAALALFSACIILVFAYMKLVKKKTLDNTGFHPVFNVIQRTPLSDLRSPAGALNQGHSPWFNVPSHHFH